MNHPHPAALPLDLLRRQCTARHTRRGGPGGQHRNKAATAVVLQHEPTGIVAEANERRSQSENLSAALFRLRVQLALEYRCRCGAAAPPSALWQSRCQGGRLVINPGHDDFPALLAEALDYLAACDDDVPAAATALGCSPTQLIKFLKHEPRALALLNGRRQAKGLRPLK